jgi:hypothetical protein
MIHDPRTLTPEDHSGSYDSGRYFAGLDKIQDWILEAKRRGAQTKHDFLSIALPKINGLYDRGDISSDECALMFKAVREAIEQEIVHG